MIEWWGEWARLRCPFYSSGEWESDVSGRVASGGSVNSML
jgi:hypothetical protein